MRLTHLFSRRPQQVTRTNACLRGEDEEEEGEEEFYAEPEEVEPTKRGRKSAPSQSYSAQIILPEVLTPREFESKLKDGIRIPSSIVKGRTYILELGKRIKVIDRGKSKVTYLCVGSRNPSIDKIAEYTALYLNLVLNENGLLNVANVMNADYERLSMQVRRRSATLLNSWVEL